MSYQDMSQEYVDFNTEYDYQNMTSEETGAKPKKSESTNERLEGMRGNY